MNCEFGFYWNGANNICVKEEDKNDGGQWGVAKVGSGIGDFTTTSTTSTNSTNSVSSTTPIFTSSSTSTIFCYFHDFYTASTTPATSTIAT